MVRANYKLQNVMSNPLGSNPLSPGDSQGQGLHPQAIGLQFTPQQNPPHQTPGSQLFHSVESQRSQSAVSAVSGVSGPGVFGIWCFLDA